MGLSRRSSDNPVLFIFLRGILENDFKAIRSTIRRELDLGPGARTLDLGCGPGAFSDLFEGDDYVGVDLNAALHRPRAEARARAPSSSPTRKHVDLPDGRFNQVLIFGLLHHLPDEEVARGAWRNARRLLGPGGRLLVIEDIPAVSRSTSSATSSTASRTASSSGPSRTTASSTREPARVAERAGPPERHLRLLRRRPGDVAGAPSPAAAGAWRRPAADAALLLALVAATVAAGRRSGTSRPSRRPQLRPQRRRLRQRLPRGLGARPPHAVPLDDAPRGRAPSRSGSRVKACGCRLRADAISLNQLDLRSGSRASPPPPSRSQADPRVAYRIDRHRPACIGRPRAFRDDDRLFVRGYPSPGCRARLDGGDPDVVGRAVRPAHGDPARPRAGRGCGLSRAARGGVSRLVASRACGGGRRRGDRRRLLGHPGRGAHRPRRGRRRTRRSALVAVLVARWPWTRRVLDMAGARVAGALVVSRPGRARPAPRDPPPSAVLLSRRPGALAVRLAAGAPRPRRLPARLHREPVPLQPRTPDGERPLVRVPLSAGVLRPHAGRW